MQKETKLDLDFKLEDLDPNASMKEQGVDSLDMASLLFEIEEYFGLSAEDEEVENGEWSTVNNILAKLAEKATK